VVDYVVMNETLPASQKAKYGQLVFLLGCLGLVYLAGSDLVIPAEIPGRWRLITVLAALPTVPALVMRVVIGAETPKWLVTRHRAAEAREVLKTMAGDENFQIPEDALVETRKKTDDGEEVAIWRRSIFWSLGFLWFVQGAVYSGSMPFLGTFLTKVGVNRKMVVFLMALSELPGVLLSGFLSHRFGRAVTLRIFFALACSAGALVATACVVGHPVLLSMAVCVFYCFHIPVWGLLFVFTPECFSAKVRGQAVGAISVLKTIPTIPSPFLGSFLLKLEQPALFMTVWASLLGVGAAASLLWMKPPRAQTWN
jgi:hypothetical protein